MSYGYYRYKNDKARFTIYDTVKKKYVSMIWCGSGVNKTEEDILYVGDSLDILHEGKKTLNHKITYQDLVDANRVAKALTESLGRKFQVKPLHKLIEKSDNYTDEVFLFRLKSTLRFYDLEMIVYRWRIDVSIPKPHLHKEMYS